MGASNWMVSRHTQLEGDPVVDLKFVACISCLQTWGCLRIPVWKWKVLLGRRALHNLLPPQPEFG